jgi:hypothetical protein
MNVIARLSLASALFALAACGDSSSGSPDDPSESGPSAAYVGKYVFRSGTIHIDCPHAPPIVYGLTHAVMGAPGYFTDTATGPKTFHHVDDNDCQFDFVVSGGSASTSGGSCQVPDGMGGTTTYTVTTLAFQPDDGGGIGVNGTGTIGECPMTIQGVTARE